ncbi:hypothetical protein N3K66_008055 [Trichothecium roseum]|uniref:Uncharacterized protein n=1 Tax=Trichothecium roseum TaxID=47278 RepID=A0ACC0USE0_9HYPO|nr:hypothetical protein N3K66_008055 [Trichothecium roseum]
MAGAKACPGRPSANNRLRRALGEQPQNPSTAVSRRRIVSGALPRLPERSSEAVHEAQGDGAAFGPSRSIPVIISTPPPPDVPTHTEGGQPRAVAANGHVLGGQKSRTTSYCNPYPATTTSKHAHQEVSADEVVELMRDSLRIKEAAGGLLTRVRSSSSSYHSRSSEPRPASRSPPPSDRRNTLRMSDFSKYSRENDRLSNLQSSSGTDGGSGEAVYDAAQDAAEAVRVWEGGGRPERRVSWNRYELPDSPEVLPSDSASLRGKLETMLGTAGGGGGGGGEEQPLPEVPTYRPSFESITTIQDQYDGAKDQDHGEPDGSPNPTTTPRPALGGIEDVENRRHKRKASAFSLRSLTSNLSKRPRLRFRKKAAGFFQRVVLRGERERQNFRNWRASQRRLKPAKALRGEHEGGYGAFKMAEKRHGDEEWWAEGVEKYRAPAWMDFDEKQQSSCPAKQKGGKAHRRDTYY